jgi:hypothetical protein
VKINKLLYVGLIGSTLLTAPALAQFTNEDQQVHNPGYVELECKPPPSDTVGRDPVSRIEVILGLDDEGSSNTPTSIGVIRHTVSGKEYKRSDRYKDNVIVYTGRGDFREWYWTGENSSKQQMIGMVSKDHHKWTYNETLYDTSSPRKEIYSITVSCRIETNGD